MKDALEAGAHVAEVLIALIAVSPFIARAIYSIRTQPPMSKEERRELLMLPIGDRMGRFQRVWTHFLRWARMERNEVLTWRELRFRNLWCPLDRHHCGKPEPSGNEFYLQCKDCRALAQSDSLEDLKSWADSGKEPWQPVKFRQRIDPTGAMVSELANKLADALQTVVSPPH